MDYSLQSQKDFCPTQISEISKTNVKYIMTSHIGDQNTTAGYQTMAFRLALHTYQYSHMIGCFPMAEYYCKNQQKQF